MLWVLLIAVGVLIGSGGFAATVGWMLGSYLIFRPMFSRRRERPPRRGVLPASDDLLTLAYVGGAITITIIGHSFAPEVNWPVISLLAVLLGGAIHYAVNRRRGQRGH
jgi:hypothetical protein